MGSVLRILDANANRAREGLRVMEEAARFMLDDAALSGAIKTLRHDLAAALNGLAVRSDLAASRDTPGDVGAGMRTASQQQRGTVADVVIAAGKRVSEALRAMEEYGKLLDSDFAARVEQLRYQGYDLEKRLNMAMLSRAGRQWRLCVLLSESLCPNGDWLKVASGAISGGADCLQLREKTLDGGELLRRARSLVDLARPRGVSVIVNDRLDVALAAEADGVHLGQADLPCREARKLAGGRLLIGVSTSNLEQARAAVRDGASYCGLGPMFPTTTKHKDIIAGPEYVAGFVAALPGVAHLAIGGITSDNVAAVTAAGALGVAASGAVCGSGDPVAATRALLAVFAGGARQANSSGGGHAAEDDPRRD
jgi:thiamine-phosphate pyrophosphorylase